LLVSRQVAAYNRKRLIEHKIPFVVPKKQLYLPPLGIDLREQFGTTPKANIKWRPSTQAAFLHLLLHARSQGCTPKEISESLGFSPMSMTRAFDEFEAAKLGRISTEGKRRVLRLDECPGSLWEKAEKYLRSPVTGRVWVKPHLEGGLGTEAGLTALARYSALAAPEHPVFALDKHEWKAMANLGGIIELPCPEPDACRLELWCYPPRLLAKNGIADRFSLFLSLRETDDERVTSALEKMMEQI